MGLLRADKNIPLQFFKDAITKYKGQIIEMNRMVTSLEVGIIVVDSSKLKEVLSPSPKRCLEDIEKLIPELAKIKNEELLSDLNGATRTLTSTPKTVEEFVEYLEFLQKTIDAQDEILNRFNNVADMYGMMEEYQVAIPEEEYALYQTLKPVFDRLKEVITGSESNKEEKMSKFITQLDQNILKLRSSILEVKNYAHHPMVIE